MSKKRKRKKRERVASAEELRETVSPIKDFKFLNPLDPDETLVFPAQRLQPGHLLQMNNTSLIRVYKEAQTKIAKSKEEELNKEAIPEVELEIAEPEKTEVVDNEKEPANKTEELEVDVLNAITSNIEYAAEIASMSIVDPETRQPIYTARDCLHYLQPAWNIEISTWALEGARPQKEGDDADAVDRFPAELEQSEEPASPAQDQ